MTERRPWPGWARLALALPLLVVPAVGIVALAGGSGDSAPAVAPGSPGGVFHPIAGGFEPDDAVLEDCGEDYACLEQAFGNIAYREGAKPALVRFEQEMAVSEPVRLDCHRIAHVIGSAAFARNDENVARTFSVGSSTCASGYYHGVLERAFVRVTTKKQLDEVARKLCVADEIRRYGFLDYQCRHGLGHGLMIQTGYDLRLALSTCGRLETRWDDVVCAGGVFMENVTTRFGYRSAWLSDDDPLHPCPEVEARHRRSCYLRAAVRVLELNDSDFADAARVCARPAAEFARACFRGYGREVVGAAKYAPGRIVSLCRLAGTGESDCLYGAARTVGDGSGLPGARRAARLCEQAPADGRTPCFEGVGVVVGLLHPTHDARQRACGRLTRAHADACSRAAVAEVDPSGRGAWG
jgi:hypothetical protein